MKELPPPAIAIDDAFWRPHLQRNATVSIFHQWQQLERTGCIENFRLVAGESTGFREGYFFADSDAYRWLDAASHIAATSPDPQLQAHMDALIEIMGRAQEEDGYLYTYNQLHFPGVRWRNLQIEHELYCHGHLIEAGVSHYRATGQRSLLDMARKAADLLVRDFGVARPEATPGHEEVELALLRLFEVTDERAYIDLAAHFIAQRGRIRPFFPLLLREYREHSRRNRVVETARLAYIAAHPEHRQRFQLPPENIVRKPWYAPLRWAADTLSGKYFQQHKPVMQQEQAEGHAVRFLYLEIAIAMLQRLRGHDAPVAALDRAWDHMIARRMVVSGGLGSNPATEGFGRDDELNPGYTHAETCAAVASIFWNQEMGRLTNEARYADLNEWQLYNAALVAAGEDGASWFYNNPLASDGYLARQSWYRCACCPSNFSRMLADLGRTILGWDEDELWVQQYVGSESRVPGLGRVRIESALPWQGEARIELTPPQPREFTLHLRLPSWCETPEVAVNGEFAPIPARPRPPGLPAAGGYDPRLSRWLSLRRVWRAGDTVTLRLPMPIRLRRTERVRATRGQVALTRGPLLYCLESVDQPDVDIFRARLQPESLEIEFSHQHFGGAVILRGRSAADESLTFIPYFLWGNRGPSQMTVYVPIE